MLNRSSKMGPHKLRWEKVELALLASRNEVLLSVPNAEEVGRRLAVDQDHAGGKYLCARMAEAVL